MKNTIQEQLDAALKANARMELALNTIHNTAKARADYGEQYAGNQVHDLRLIEATAKAGLNNG